MFPCFFKNFLSNPPNSCPYYNFVQRHFQPPTITYYQYVYFTFFFKNITYFDSLKIRTLSKYGIFCHCAILTHFTFFYIAVFCLSSKTLVPLLGTSYKSFYILILGLNIPVWVECICTKDICKNTEDDTF